MWNSTPFDEANLEGFERSETRNGLPYYINHNTQSTLWDHPFYIQTFEDLGSMNSCRYAAYRTAIKIRYIQKKFGFEDVTLHSVQSVLGRRGLGREVDTMIDCHELYLILTDLLATELQAELALNWLLNLYDPNRSGSIMVASVKTGLSVVCSARLSEKYRYLFQLSTDHTNTLGRKRLGSLLEDLIQIPDIMNESHPFGGRNVEPAVNSCFSMVWNAVGASEDIFLAWLLREPQTLVWLPTLHRLAAAENVRHECKCNVCKTFPIMGFRYRCLKCFNFDMCQTCFFTGRTARSHKLKHPTQEYCINTTSKDDTKAFMKTIRNNLSRKHRNKKKLRYLPIQGGGASGLSRDNRMEGHEVLREVHYLPGHRPTQRSSLDERQSPDLDIMIQNRDTGENEKTMREKEETLRIGDRQRRELESIIEHLENENRELMMEIEDLYQRRRDGSVSSDDVDDVAPRNDYRYQQPTGRRPEVYGRPDSARQEVLKAHNQQLEIQLQRLRNILGAQADELVQGRREPLQPVSPNIPRQRELSFKASPSSPPRPYQLPPAYQLSVPRNNQDSNCFLTPKTKAPVSSTFLHGHHTAPPPLSGAGISRVNSRLSNNSRLDYEEIFRTSYQDQFDMYSAPIPDTSYTSYDGALSRTQFSLPSAGKSQHFPNEEAELEELIDRLDMAYPGDMTHSVLGFGDYKDELCRAGNQIGEAFTAHMLPGNYQDEFNEDGPSDQERDYLTDEEDEIETIRTTRVTQHQYLNKLAG